VTPDSYWRRGFERLQTYEIYESCQVEFPGDRIFVDLVLLAKVWTFPSKIGLCQLLMMKYQAFEFFEAAVGWL